MSERDWQEEFGKLVEDNYSPEEIPDPEVGLSLKDIATILSYVNESALCLSLFISKYLDNEDIEFPEYLANTLHSMGAVAEALIEGLTIFEDDEDCG